MFGPSGVYWFSAFYGATLTCLSAAIFTSFLNLNISNCKFFIALISIFYSHILLLQVFLCIWCHMARGEAASKRQLCSVGVGGNPPSLCPTCLTLVFYYVKLLFLDGVSLNVGFKGMEFHPVTRFCTFYTPDSLITSLSRSWKPQLMHPSVWLSASLSHDLTVMNPPP